MLLVGGGLRRVHQNCGAILFYRNDAINDLQAASLFWILRYAPKLLDLDESSLPPTLMWLNLLLQSSLFHQRLVQF